MESRFQTEETSEQESARLSHIAISPTQEGLGCIEPESTQQETTPSSSPTQGTETSSEVTAHIRQVDPLGYEILSRLKKKARMRGTINWTLAILMVISTFFLPDGRVPGNLEIVLFLGAVFFLYGYSWIDRQRTRRELDQIDDVRMVGPLAEALDAERFIKPTPIIAALRRLLPRMQHSDAKSLTPAQRGCLYRALYKHASRSKWIFDKELALEILKAMRQIGDKEAVPHVKRVATWSGDSRLRDAANDCLPFLMAQQEEFNRSQTYLRPSSASEMGTDSLLRASIEETPTKPEQLLRAANGISEIDNTP